MGDPLDHVELTSFEFSTIVGILPSERLTPQPLALEVRLGLPLGAIAESGDLSLGVDYAATERELTALAQEGRFWLIETFAVAAVRWLLLPPTPAMARGQVHEAGVVVRKPTILAGRAVPGVSVARRGVPSLQVDVRDGVSRTTLAETAKDGAWRLVLGPGARTAIGPEQGGLVVAGSVRARGEDLQATARVPRGAGEVVAGRDGAVVLLAGAPVPTTPRGVLDGEAP